MQKENYELNLLSSVSKTLIENADPVEILTLLGRIFNRFGRASNKFVELKTLNIFIYDENTKLLRDFSKSWVVIDQNLSAYNEKLYLVITQLSQFSFFVNGVPYKMEELTNFQNIKTNNEFNTILFPLKKNNKPFGILELTFPNSIENLLDHDFFMMLSIASYQISLKIQNTILAEQMQKNIDFHKSMRSIAKIIETQYELNYIIPIIGEMIDRFVSTHLVYVFLKNAQDDKFELVWPSSCRDNEILSMLTKVKAESKYMLINDNKIGIFPLIGQKSVLGCIVAHSNTDKLSEKEVAYLDQLSKQSSITIQRANTYAETLQHATLDALTGLNNRRQFEARLSQEVATAKRQGKPLCAMMLDMDFFKSVNDTYGHIVGDLVLKNLSKIIKGQLRESDIASRYGGEEFAILLPFTNIDEAVAVGERLRKAVEASEVPLPPNVEAPNGEKVVKRTVSIGVHQYSDTESAQELYKRADEALYVSKTTGRNQVIVFSPDMAGAEKKTEKKTEHAVEHTAEQGAGH